jgi:hypothetical protein
VPTKYAVEELFSITLHGQNETDCADVLTRLCRHRGYLLDEHFLVPCRSGIYGSVRNVGRIARRLRSGDDGVDSLVKDLPR